MEFKIRIQKSRSFLKAITILLLLLSPIIMYSDGGTIPTKCTSYKDYDIQPAKVVKLRMVLTGLKINGKEQGVNYKKLLRDHYGYHFYVSQLDTLDFKSIIVNEENSEIIGFDCDGTFSKQ